MYSLGFDVGSSSVKAALIDIESNQTLATVKSPDQEMQIHAPKAGWAEQDPETWWHHVRDASHRLLEETKVDKSKITSIGVAYQMHGLVVLDKDGQVLRPSIIWCDGRANQQGKAAFDKLGAQKCIHHLLNAPGNFTASKLAWVQQNEPQLFERIDKAMLPGDYIGFKMTGEITTTATGLSEGTLWDFQNESLANFLVDHFEFGSEIIPPLVPIFGAQGKLTSTAAKELGLNTGTPLLYRAGDQPNNALSLGALQPGDLAGSGGTSGVIYGVSDQLIKDESQRINSFLHVNHTAEQKRVGVLLCINATGIAYRWIKDHLAPDLSYTQLEHLAQEAEPGADGLTLLPFGNGGERILNFKNEGAQLIGLDFNRHSTKEMVRATLEGIAFSFVHGLEIMKGLGVSIGKIKVGNDNLFQSTIFSQIISNLTSASIEMYETTGAIGAAKGAAYAAGHYNSLEEAVSADHGTKSIMPQSVGKEQEAYEKWKNELKKSIEK
ncbi:MAG: FGGY family carbohydrate kinase [Bacteroidota bacterium]